MKVKADTDRHISCVESSRRVIVVSVLRLLEYN